MKVISIEDGSSQRLHALIHTHSPARCQSQDSEATGGMLTNTEDGTTLESGPPAVKDHTHCWGWCKAGSSIVSDLAVSSDQVASSPTATCLTYSPHVVVQMF